MLQTSLFIILACLGFVDMFSWRGIGISSVKLQSPALKKVSIINKSVGKNEIMLSATSISSFPSPPCDAELMQPVDPGWHIKVKGKYILNLWGVYCAAVTFFLASVVMPILVVATLVSQLVGSGMRRTANDWIIHIWANLAMTACGSVPRLYGMENLQKLNDRNPVIYVPNHTSFLDILLVSGFIPRPFKYLSKAEIKSIPIIGWGMSLAMHVFLKRDGDMRSTLAATDLCLKRIRDGNSMVLFAEGTRSPDGVLKAFKKGAFQMAKETGAKIVPVSIGNLQRWMPSNALLPLARMRHTYIKVHEPIDPSGKTVNQMRKLCHEAVNSGLPVYQQQLKETPP